jgi:ABC-type Na+ efflux pump permease subunit
MPFLAVGIVLFVAPDLGTSPATALIPLLGPALVLRDAVSGDLDAVAGALSIVTTVVTVGLLLRFAAGRFGSERRMQRLG